MRNFQLLTIILGIVAIAGVSALLYAPQKEQAPQSPTTQTLESTPETQPEPVKPKVELLTPPVSKTLTGGTHTFQTFNNCGPAAFSMALSYYGITKTQKELGNELRPYQVPSGDNDDKSTTLEEIAQKSKEFDLVPFHRPNGSIELIKQFITYDMPVIARTWLKENDDIGHYRVVKGYTETELIQDDSLQGKDLRYSFDSFNALWKKFNYEYVVLAPFDKQEVVEAILGEEADPAKSWAKAVESARAQLLESPNDKDMRFNLSVALYHIGEFQRSVDEFEKVETLLPFRTLWYQIEPIESYYELGNYNRVFAITDKILNNQNRAFSELYLIRGEIYKKQGNLEAARSEFEKAVLYNINLKSAQQALNSVQ